MVSGWFFDRFYRCRLRILNHRFYLGAYPQPSRQKSSWRDSNGLWSNEDERIRIPSLGDTSTLDCAHHMRGLQHDALVLLVIGCDALHAPGDLLLVDCHWAFASSHERYLALYRFLAMV